MKREAAPDPQFEMVELEDAYRQCYTSYKISAGKRDLGLTDGEIAKRCEKKVKREAEARQPIDTGTNGDESGIVIGS